MNPSPTRIFVSYRREDTSGYAIGLRDRLARHYKAGQIFMDIDNIEPGEDFVDTINQRVGACDVLVALIGKSWLTCTDEAGRRRLDSPDDFVRLEVTAGLERKIRVIPVLVAGARPPKPEELPGQLAPLARLNAIEVSDTRFHQDIDRLINAIDKVLDFTPEERRAPEKVMDATAATVPSSSNRRMPLAGAFVVLLGSVAVWIGLEIGVDRDPLAWLFLLAIPTILVAAYAFFVRRARQMPPHRGDQ